MPEALSEARITEQLRLRLDEAEFVYQHLPTTLERARKGARVDAWRTFFREQAGALRAQRKALRAIADQWGLRIRPCFSPTVEKQLNEARLAVTDRRARPTMERTVQDVINSLRTRVLAGLEEAAHLALRMRENELAQHLLLLSQDERLQLGAVGRVVTDM